MPHFEKLSFCSGGNHKAPTPQNGQTNSHNSFDHFVGLVLKGLNRLPVTEAYLVSCQVSLKILEIKFCLQNLIKIIRKVHILPYLLGKSLITENIFWYNNTSLNLNKQKNRQKLCAKHWC